MCLLTGDFLWRIFHWRETDNIEQLHAKLACPLLRIRNKVIIVYCLDDNNLERSILGTNSSNQLNLYISQFCEVHTANKRSGNTYPFLRTQSKLSSLLRRSPLAPQILCQWFSTISRLQNHLLAFDYLKTSQSYTKQPLSFTLALCKSKKWEPFEQIQTATCRKKANNKANKQEGSYFSSPQVHL